MGDRDTPRHTHTHTHTRKRNAKGELKAIKMAPRPLRGRCSGCAKPGWRNPGGFLDRVTSPGTCKAHKSRWGCPGARSRPLPASPRPRRTGLHTPAGRIRPAPGTFGLGERGGLVLSPQTRGRGARAFGGVRAGRGGGRASNPSAACGSGRIRELAL